MRIVEESRTYKNAAFVLIGASEQEAYLWARRNRPSGWTIAAVTRTKHTADNYTVRFRKE